MFYLCVRVSYIRVMSKRVDLNKGHLNKGFSQLKSSCMGSQMRVRLNEVELRMC